MEAVKSKKTDRRTLYSKKVIREAFLLLKRTKAYNDITVTDICREAEISRGTFYLHYRNTAEVLDEVLEEALSFTRRLEEQLYPHKCANTQCNYPLCQYIRSSQEYRCLFFDDALSSMIVEKIYATHKEDIIRMWENKTKLSQEQLAMIAYFQINGCFAAAKRSANFDDEKWAETQKVIDTFIRSGIHCFDA